MALSISGTIQYGGCNLENYKFFGGPRIVLTTLQGQKLAQ